MDRRDFAIGILTTTAAILLVGLLLVPGFSPPVFADGMSVSGGDYILTVGAIYQIDEEVLYVFDVPQERIVAYRFNPTKREIEVFQGIDLKKIRKESAESGQPPSKPSPGGRKP